MLLLEDAVILHKPKEHIEFVYYGYGIKLMQFLNFIYPIYYILSSLILINMQEKK